MARILVTNDDGIHSKGLYVLARAAGDVGEAFVVAPEKPKSTTGLGMTLHKPLRVKKTRYCTRCYAISGTPSDVVHMAVNVISGPVDLVLSGINVGDNTSIQVILSSGTIGAAAHAALLGIPAIAFSMAVSDDDEIVRQEDLLVPLIRSAAQYVLEHPLPRGVDVISVNFPATITRDTEVLLAPAARQRWRELVEERIDPLGREYYWIYGEPTDIEPNTDVDVVLNRGAIAVTPLSFDVNALPTTPHDRGERIRQYMLDLVSKMRSVVR